ncbi:MAG: hypothetical protein GY821_14585 [Gammaproteobacteria bacterium]|nr:hypothetical protein [Gammaproteobacteria bacterium]
MSYKWPDKDKDEIVDYSIDWSRFLGTDTVSAATWFLEDADGTKVELSDATVVNGLQYVTGTLTNTVTTIRLSLGTNNVRYKVTCQITTAQGLQYERTVFVRVREK